MRFARILALLLVGAAARADAAPSTSAAASAYGNTDSHTGTGSISANASIQGSPGTAAATCTADLGGLVSWATMTGCVIQFPPFQQICNDGNSQSSFGEQVMVVSDAPYGTPVQVQATYQVSGQLQGTGVYSYLTSANVNNTGLPGVSASSGGTTVFGASSPISGGGTVAVGTSVGASMPVAAYCNVEVEDRYCDGGSQNCNVSDTDWSISLWLSCALTLSVPTLPPGATYVHLVSESGHDYSQPPASVGGSTTRREGLAPARPNPARDGSLLDLTLARGRNVDVGVFDLAGRRVATLADGALSAGVHTLAWDGRDGSGTRVRAGVYFVRAVGEGLDATREVLRLQ
jgi:hypothetical protein